MLDWLFKQPLEEGSPAPDFDLADETGKRHSLASFEGKNLILVFYPGDDTPTCRKQLCEMRDSWQEAEARDTAVVGINPQGAASHARFREKFGFPFPLLIDKGKHAARLYHADGWIVRRTVYLIGKSRRIRFARRGKPSPAEVLAAAE